MFKKISLTGLVCGCVQFIPVAGFQMLFGMLNIEIIFASDSGSLPIAGIIAYIFIKWYLLGSFLGWLTKNDRATARFVGILALSLAALFFLLHFASTGQREASSDMAILAQHGKTAKVRISLIMEKPEKNGRRQVVLDYQAAPMKGLQSGELREVWEASAPHYRESDEIEVMYVDDPRFALKGLKNSTLHNIKAKAYVNHVTGRPITIDDIMSGRGTSEAVITFPHAYDDGAVVRNGQRGLIRPGEPLVWNETVQTGAGSGVDISVKGLASLRLLPDSQIKLARVLQTEVEFQLASGGVLVNQKQMPAGYSFTIRANSAAARLHGTQLLARSSGAATFSGVSTFVVGKGTADIDITVPHQGWKKVVLTAGRAIDVTRSTGECVERPASSEEIAAMEQAGQILNE